MAGTLTQALRGARKGVRVAPMAADNLRASERRLVQLLGELGPMTRGQVAEISGLPLGTGGGAASRLIAKGVLLEDGAAQPRTSPGPGRPPKRRLLREASPVVGVGAVTHARLRAALVTESAEIVARTAKPYRWPDSPDLI